MRKFIVTLTLNARLRRLGRVPARAHIRVFLLPRPAVHLVRWLQVSASATALVRCTNLINCVRHCSLLCDRAEEWGLDKPLISPHGEVKVMQKGDVCFVRLFDPKKDESGNTKLVLFAEAPIRVDDKFAKKGVDFYVQKVVDSSRYFVVRVEVSNVLPRHVRWKH